MRVSPALLSLLIAVAPAAAQAPAQMPKAPPGAPDTARIVAGNYAIEPHHTQVMFALDHLGFSVFRGFFSGVSGTLSLNPARVTDAKLSVTVPIASMPGALAAPNGFGAKVVSAFHGVGGRSRHQGLVILFDHVSGAPLARARISSRDATSRQ